MKKTGYSRWKGKVLKDFYYIKSGKREELNHIYIMAKNQKEAIVNSADLSATGERNNMKKFRILYWIGSIITEKYVLAENEKEARKKFNRVYKIEEVIKEKKAKKWIPQIGEHVFSVCEFMLCGHDRDRILPGYSTQGFEIIESVVKEPYIWKKCGAGIKTVSINRKFDSNGECFFFKPGEYGVKVFRTFEEAIPLAEEMTYYYEKHYLFGEKRQKYRHWRQKSTQEVKHEHQ